MPPRAPGDALTMNTLKIHNPATGTLLAEPNADDAASVAAKAAAARAAQPAWAARAAGREAGRRAALPRRRGGRTRRAGAHADAGDGQAHHAGAQRAQRPAAAHRLLPRADRTLGPRRACLRRRRHARADHAHPAGRGGQHLGLELPVVRRLQRHRAGAADRQCRALQAQRTCHADRPAHHPAAARRRRAGRRDAVPGGRRRGRQRRCWRSGWTACSSPAAMPPACASRRRWRRSC